MSEIRAAFVDAAVSAAGLLSDPAVAAAWDGPSVLPEFSIAGLAGHLAAQVLNVPKALAAPVGEAEPLTLADHYAAVRWRGTGPDEDVNVGIRTSGEEIAAAGPAALVAQVDAVIAEVRVTLPAEPADRAVFLPWTGWSLSLDDLLVTRMMEIAVHSDDLGASVGVPAPDLPPAVLDPVLGLLFRLAVGRHGQAAVLRALARAERAPASIAAI